MAAFPPISLEERSSVPIYRQIADQITVFVQEGKIAEGERLPATRELAGQLGLNRATISAAYALLEQTGLLAGHVGRGSFVARRPVAPGKVEGPDWTALVGTERPSLPKGSVPVQINFASSRPDGSSFPLSAFRKVAAEVITGPEVGEILQLGSSYGYAPLRRFLLQEAISEGSASAADSVLITNGCQQALDLLARTFQGWPGDPSLPGVVVEDPSYHGLLRIFSRTGLPLYPVPVSENGIDLDLLEATLVRHRPRLLVVTPSFHNPTGATLSLAARRRILELVASYGLILIENDIYSQLRYLGDPLPTLKQLDPSGNTILLRSYSKVAFPGLRVGWVIGPRGLIARLADEKQVADLHSDQLSQAVLLRFAETGELARHLQRTNAAGRERLRVTLHACHQFLPAGSRWTRPEGGMSLWIELPAPLFAEQILTAVRAQGVDFLPGRHFAPKPAHERAFRISFGALPPAQIEAGLRLIGQAAVTELAAFQERLHAEPAMALV